MRPLKLLLAIATSLLTVVLLSFFAARHSAHSSSAHDRSIHTFFDWRSPSSLFPPSAIISLTDDNSTFFLARPANFGPLLPRKGFSGQLWIGSGFGDDDLARGGGSRSEGELGCSDVPGWDEGRHGGSSGRTGDDEKSTKSSDAAVTDPDSPLSPLRRRGVPEALPEGKKSLVSPKDGTDDHLHQDEQSIDAKKQSHADIQSIQESAEIAGKIVLLSRGGCGFLEKVKWVQRRGGTALIVGDNIRGGPLVTMYARGDTSNVTIPAVFTSHTTAHLLSSLMPFGTSVDGSMADGIQKARVPVTSSYISPLAEHVIDVEADAATTKKVSEAGSRSWWSILFGSRAGRTGTQTRNVRPGWVMEEDFDTSVSKQTKTEERPTSKKSSKEAIPVPGDGFAIGIQDWRDPDLVETRPAGEVDGSKTSTKPPAEQRTDVASPRGGSITPGSGIYGRKAAPTKPKAANGKTDTSSKAADKGAYSGSAHKLSTPADISTDAKRVPEDAKAKTNSGGLKSDSADQRKTVSDEDGGRLPHEGLWITLSPTTMSSSPFFDTLLVLVVSPLVTLTVVYALLLLRSRIRRRRWRAPKSVVERLPVRTYYTIASSAATTSSAQPSPPATPRTPTSTTPLLSAARPIGQRPRSRTTSEVPVASSSYARSAPMSPALDQIQEKKEAGLLEWKRKYGGKQRECVVCLEEYIDGVSRVMSLPCGHEFHADCITPWLTTRRRTCPICKGDVVRSLARTANTNPSTNTNDSRDDTYDENDDEPLDGVQRQAADSRNDDPDAAIPMSRDDEAFEDLERGVPDRDR